MAKKLLLFIFLIISLVSSAADANRKFTLCIDPGHGGKDAGCVSRSYVPGDGFAPAQQYLLMPDGTTEPLASTAW